MRLKLPPRTMARGFIAFASTVLLAASAFAQTDIVLVCVYAVTAAASAASAIWLR